MAEKPGLIWGEVPVGVTGLVLMDGRVGGGEKAEGTHSVSRRRPSPALPEWCGHHPPGCWSRNHIWKQPLLEGEPHRRPGTISLFSFLSSLWCLNTDRRAMPRRAGRPTLWSNSHLDQEVLLRVLMKGGHSSLGTKPGINGDLFLLPVAQAAVVGDADVPLQLRDLWGLEHRWEAEPQPGTHQPRSQRTISREGQTHTALLGNSTTVSVSYCAGTEKPIKKINTQRHLGGSVR